VHWDLPFTIRAFVTSHAAGSSATATLEVPGEDPVEDEGDFDEDEPEDPEEDEDGSWEFEFPPTNPLHGNGFITIRILPPTPEDPDGEVIFPVYIDPSGFIRTTDGVGIPDATVILFRSDFPDGPFTQVPDGSDIMSPSNRQNPDLTDAIGHFGWDVIAGYYKVRAQKAGCHAPGDPNQAFVETVVYEIPPPVTDVDLRLQCPAPVTPGPDPEPDPPPGGDGSPPDTTITGGPKSKEKKGKATFTFISSEAGSTFECSLDGGPFESCTSPEEVKVKKGKHEFAVRARDAAGNVDPSPASQSWTVKKKKKK
jgi:hypothetical protein